MPPDDSDLVNPQSIPEGGTEATVRRRAARGTDLDPSEIDLESDRRTGELQTSLTREARLERAAAQSDAYAAEDLRVEDGEVSLREQALRREAAEGTVYDAEDLRVTDDGEVEPRREPGPEQVDLTLWEPGDASGEVAWVGPDGQRIETGERAGATEEDPYFARVDVPDREGQWRLQVGDETVNRVNVGPAGAARDVSEAALNRGWNANVITVDAASGSGGAYESESAYQQPASADEDVVAGAGAAEALQAGAEPEQLSQVNPISESEGDAIAEALEQQQDVPTGNPAMRGTEANTQLRQRLAEQEEGINPDDIDVVYQGDDLRARIEGDARSVDPETATQQARDRGVGDGQPDALDRLDGDADRGVSITRPGGRGGVVTGAPDAERQLTIEEGQADRGVGVTRGPEGTTVVRPDDNGGDQGDSRDIPAWAQTQRGGASGDTSQTDPQQPAGPLDYAVDLAFQDSEEVAPFFGLSGAAARRDTVDLGGPTLTFEAGERDPVNTTVTNALTTGRGRFNDETVANVRDRAEGYEEFFGVGEEADRVVTNLTGSEKAGNLARGIGDVPGEVAAAPSRGALAYDTAWNVGRNLPGAVDEYGATAVSEAAITTSGAVLQGTTQAARRRPYQTAGSLAGEAALGTAAVRAGGSLGGRVRSARVRRQADETVELEEITNEQGVEGDLPNFETDRGAPTSEAIDEVRERAADNPETVTDRLGTDRAVYHSTEADLGDGFEATRGSSELPGLFVSPDASPLRLQEGASSSFLSRPEIRLPRASDFTGGSDRFAGFEGDDVRGMAEGATGSGRIPDGDGGYEPDPSTSGAQFLDDQAEEGAAYVRPQGGRTTELEAIFPPGSEFDEATTLAVDLPSGRTVPLDLFKRRQADGDGDTAEGVVSGPGVGDRTASEIADRYSTRLDDTSDPVTPPTGVGASTSSGGASAGRGVSSTPPSTTARSPRASSAGTSSMFELGSSGFGSSSSFGRGTGTGTESGGSSGSSYFGEPTSGAPGDSFGGSPSGYSPPGTPTSPSGSPGTPPSSPGTPPGSPGTPPSDPGGPSPEDFDFDFDGDPDRGAEGFAEIGDVFSSGIVANPFEASER